MVQRCFFGKSRAFTGGLRKTRCATFRTTQTRLTTTTTTTTTNLRSLYPLEKSTNHCFNRSDHGASSLESIQQRPWLWDILSAAAAAVIVTGFINATTSTSSTMNHVDLEARQQKKSPPQRRRRSMVCTDSVCNMYVSVLQKQQDGRLIYLLGTAHQSPESAKLAQELVKDVQPDAVFVEWDIPRALARRNDVRFLDPTTTSHWSDKEAKQVQELVSWVCLQPHKVLVPTSHVLGWKEDEEDSLVEQKPRLHFRAPKLRPNHLYDWNKFDSKTKATTLTSTTPPLPVAAASSLLEPKKRHHSGQEFVNAMKEGVKLGAVIVLGDRDVQRDADRVNVAENPLFMRKGRDYLLLSETEKKMLESVQGGTFTANQQIRDGMRQQEKLLERVQPLYYEVILKERNEYMAVGLDVLGQFDTIVAVVGAMHLEGMEQYLQEYGWNIVPKNCPKI